MQQWHVFFFFGLPKSYVVASPRSYLFPWMLPRQPTNDDLLATQSVENEMDLFLPKSGVGIASSRALATVRNQLEHLLLLEHLQQILAVELLVVCQGMPFSCVQSLSLMVDL